ncbi:hypothetical protein MNBD_GAMMA09-2223 [hydrothermal vent metagenome]|uniref:GGDEF domain-containing protein n=1 Tax=hydrothermal vent metagenome TaxID=652676 RepID=A0A3B0XPY2_9ZZZZ
MFDYQLENEITPENKHQLDQDLNRGLALLVIIAASVVASSWLFLLPVYFDIKIVAQVFPLLLSGALLFLSSRIQSACLNKPVLIAAYLLSFISWSFVIYLSAAIPDDSQNNSAVQLSGVANSVYLLGLCFLLIWSSRYIKHYQYLSLASAVSLVLILFMFTPLSITYLIAVLLLLGSSVALSASSLNIAAVSSKDIEEFSGFLNDELLLTAEPKEEEIVPELEIDAIPLDETSVSYDWELILRELNSELKSTADVDQLFKRMLVFLHGAMEYDAAAVGMLQDRSIKKIAIYGGDEFLQSKPLNWSNQRVKKIFSSREPITGKQANSQNPESFESLHRLDVPVISGQKVVGLVTLFRESASFNENDMKLAASVVFHSMVALREARLQEEIKRLSSISLPTKLTLYNREQFVSKVKPVFDKLNKPRECSLFIVEIDNIDTVIDSQGRDAGVLLYKAISKTIMSELRNNDIFGRYGNDGFIILLDETDMNHAKSVAENVRNKVSKIKLTYQNSDITTTVSIGLTIVSDQKEDLPSLMRKADMGLFVAKENGRNTIKVSL